MKISKDQAKANRERVVAVASELFRARGFDDVPVGDVMKAAGFTHGGFYNHFSSKQALAAEALQSAWSQMAGERARADGVAGLLPHYLSRAARKAPGKTCPAAALAGDIGRQPDDLKAVFAGGLEDMIASIADGLEGEEPARRERAVALVARMVGALMLSRAVPDDDPLAGELLDANLRAALAEIGEG